MDRLTELAVPIADDSSRLMGVLSIWLFFGGETLKRRVGQMSLTLEIARHDQVLLEMLAKPTHALQKLFRTISNPISRIRAVRR